MQESEITLLLGKFEAKIASLEKSVERLELCVEKLALAMSENKNGWQILLMLGSISAIIGSTLHKPIEALISLFK